MDETDSQISFNAEGVCNYCEFFAKNLPKLWFPNEEGANRLKEMVAEIRANGRGKKYDCVIGLSGGVDSSYLALKAKEWGLRVLVVHVDAGWNSELAVKNIEHIVKKLGFDLFTQVIDWEEVRDLHLSFLKAGVPNQDIPQDHAFMAALYKAASRQGIRYVLTGNNLATESVLPRAWGHGASDLRHIRDIHRKYGTRPLKTYPKLGLFEFYFFYRRIKGMRIVDPLNYMPYSKALAIQELQDKLGWRYYGGKHYESRFTKFFQAYFLPTKFGFDKRKAHLSSLIISGEISREQALDELSKPLYPEAELRADKEFVLKKLGLSDNQFEKILKLPNRAHSEFKTNRWALRIASLNFKYQFKRVLRVVRARLTPA